MEFTNNINSLRKEFFEAVRLYYNKSNLVLKILCEMGIYKDVSSVDLYFRTCCVSKFSDRYIQNVRKNNMDRAINLLRARAISCMYTSMCLNDILSYNICLDDKYLKFREKIKEIIKKLDVLSNASIKQSNKWAQIYNLPIFCDGKIVDNDSIDTKIN